VLESDAKLEQQLKAADAGVRDRRRRVRWAGASAASYALDTAFLGLFAWAGTVPAAAAVAFGAGAVLICGGQFLAYATGINLKARDPNLTELFIILAIAMNLAVVAVAPHVTFPFLANQFTIFAFGMIWLPVRDSFVVWTLGALGLGAVLLQVGPRIDVPASNGFELLLTWAYFSLVMGRCLMLSVYAGDMRTRLGESRRRLAASLAQVRELASHDELTRTLNRRALTAQLEQERARAERSGAPFCIAMMDLDRFKSVNDTYGHAAGDAVLRGFAATVRQTMRGTDAFGRYGGEEFLMILVATPLDAALEALERVRAAVEATDWRAITPHHGVTVSAGVACHRKGENVEQLLHRADQALYEAKHAGRNRVVRERA